MLEERRISSHSWSVRVLARNRRRVEPSTE
jgi:hypothetical protein